jgi:hypothetical protein
VNIKQLFCKHEYEHIGTIKTLWCAKDNDEPSPIYTEFLECPQCHKRKVLYQYEHLVNVRYRRMFKLWEKHQLKISEDWFL